MSELFDLGSEAAIRAFAERWNLKPDDEHEKESIDDAPVAAPPSALVTADAAIQAVIDSGDAALIYSDDLIIALARAGDIKQHEARRRLKEVFGKSLVVREFNSRLRGAEEKLLTEQPPSKYLMTTNGLLKECVANAITMMRELALSYDAFACRIVVTDELPWRKESTGTHWTDTDDVRAAEWCQHQLLNIKPPVAAEAAMVLAGENTTHPVQQYLNEQEWDGIPRLDTMLSTYFGCDDKDYTRSVGAKWMIQAVNRVMDPGCQADYTLVLEGPQGKKKSTALRVLCGSQWFSDDLMNLDTKDAAIQLMGKWIMEVAELDAIGKVDMKTTKKWIIRRVDNFRPPYGRRNQDFPRQNVFAGTTNRYDWGNDDTGLRRFLPVRVKQQIDIEALARDRNQLWAEAAFRFSEGEEPFLAGLAEKLAMEEQAARQERDAWTDRVEDWVDEPLFSSTIPNMAVSQRSSPARIYMSEILFHCLGIMPKDWNKGQRDRVARILKLAGYISKRGERRDAEPDGRRPEYWIKTAASAESE